MNDSTNPRDGMPPTNGPDPVFQGDTEDRITAAFTELKEDAAMVRPNPQPNPGWIARYPWAAPLLGAAAAFALVVGIVALSGDDGTEVETPFASDGVTAPTSSEAPTPSTDVLPETTIPVTSEVPTTTEAPTTALPPGGLGPIDPAFDPPLDVLTVGDDGYFPWLFPSPTLSWYEEGCPSPESVAVDFIANLRGVTGVEISVLDGQEFQSGVLVLEARSIDGDTDGQATQLAMVRVDPGLAGVTCEAWGVYQAASSDAVRILNPGPGDLTGNPVAISGDGHGFEANIGLSVFDETYSAIGRSSASGGNFGNLAPFSGDVVLENAPLDLNMVLVAVSSGGRDNWLEPFAAVKGKWDQSTIDPEIALADPIGPVAVIGVAADDTLNARTGAGVDNDVLGEIDPFEIGITQYDISEQIGDSTWVQIGNPQSRDFDAWVNAAFVTLVEGDADQTSDFYNTLTGVRSALAQDGSAPRLSDALAAAGFGPVRVSSDGFFNDEDQVLSTADLAGAGTAVDTDRVWGSTDGEGSPIEMTIAEMFDVITANPGLAQTERVAVNERIRFGNTIDNAQEYFPGSTVVELHYAGGDNPDFEWATVRLVFAPNGAGHRLVGIALDGWTI